MHTYVLLLRGINVGGKNKMPMAALKAYLEELGLQNVSTYIQSGNVVVRSPLSAAAVGDAVERMLPKKFKLDGSGVRVLALNEETLRAIVAQAPSEFGNDPARYRYDVVFLMGVTPGQAMQQVTARPGIDQAWQGAHAIYYRRPSLASPDATKSYLGKITQQPIYKSVTIRNWNTTLKLLAILDER